MPKTALQTLKSWFLTGLKPTQQQFHNWLDSFWHKDDQISSSNIDGLSTALDSKVDKVAGKGLSTNDFTSTDKAKLDDLTPNVKSDWNASAGSAQEILNKPDLSAKVDKVAGKGLSTNDFTTSDKSNLDALIVHTHSDSSGNSYIGDGALADKTTAQSNTAVGVSSLSSLTSGIQNTAVGWKALGQYNASGRVGIGYKAGFNDNTNNKLHIANSEYETLIEGSFDEKWVRINSKLEFIGISIFSTVAPAGTIAKDVWSNELYVSDGWNWNRILTVNPSSQLAKIYTETVWSSSSFYSINHNLNLSNPDSTTIQITNSMGVIVSTAGAQLSNSNMSCMLSGATINTGDKITVMGF